MQLARKLWAPDQSRHGSRTSWRAMLHPVHRVCNVMKSTTTSMTCEVCERRAPATVQLGSAVLCCTRTLTEHIAN